MSKFPLIVDVKRHSLEDGPGIRSVVFFKGCPLRCIFCQNPETQEAGTEIAFFPEKCILCGDCVDACAQGVINLEFPGRIDREKCIRCGECAGACPGNALKTVGAAYTVEALVELLLRDRAFYHHSGGGVTLSGGECTLYPDYLETLLQRLKAEDIHVTLETSGYFDYHTFKRKILPYIGLVFYDIKLADPESHKQHLGKPNRLILDNFRKLLQEEGVEVHPRIPLVPGITAGRENLSAIVRFLCEAGAEKASLLPYNPLGLDMTVNLGKPKPPLSESFMEVKEEKEIYEVFKKILEERQIKLARFFTIER